jgi:hypothetical protein
MKKRTRKIWGGFVGGKLDWGEVDDHWGGLNERPALALFTSHKEAREQYQDVRAVEITYLEGVLTRE